MEVDCISVFFKELKDYFITNSENGQLTSSELDLEVFSKLDSFLMHFIIEGNFVKYIHIVEKQIEEKVEEFTNSILTSNFKLDQNIATIVIGLNAFIKEFSKILIQFLNIIESYSEVSNHVVHKYNTFIETDNKSLKVLCEYCNLFILDYSISDDRGFLKKLKIQYSRFNKVQIDYPPFNHRKIFEHKYYLLRYKWLKRQKYNRIFLKEKIRNDYSEKIVLNDEIIDLDKKILIGEPYYKSYKEWIDKIEYHYFEGKVGAINTLKENLDKKENLNSYEIYLSIKKLKDEDEDLGKLLLVKDQIESCETKGYLKEKSLFYLYNNCFSLFILDENKTFVDVTKEYKRLQKIFNKKGNHNFFIHLKYLTYVVSRLQDNSQDLPEGIDFSEIYKSMEKCKSNFQWCIQGLNLIYDFSFDESFVTIEGVDVYHASSFSLPLSVIENEWKIQEVERNLRKCEYEYDRRKLSENIRDQNNTLVTKIESLNNKSIQTITIFTAIISFIVGTVSVYKFIESFLQALITMIAFGVSISIFVFLVFLSTRGIEQIKKYRTYIMIIYGASLLLMGGLFWLMTIDKLKLPTPQRYLYQQELDSITKAYQEDILQLQKDNYKIREKYKNIEKLESELRQEVEAFKRKKIWYLF
ncbi:hypothetical protein ACYSNM_12990 [Myroides sp. LJL116]